MWSIQNLLSEAEAAKERLVSVIGQHRPSDSASVLSSSSSFQQDPQQQQQQQQTGETQQQPSSSSSASSSPSSFQNQPTIATIPGNNSNNNNNKSNNNNNEQVLNTLKSTLTSALTATKAATQQAIHTLEKEQTKIQARLFQSSNKGTSPYYLRDISLPLDTESLFDAEVVYITDRLITMGHPAMQSPVNGDVTPERKLAAVQHLLQKRHGNGKYMIWNLSELEYDYSIFDNQVMTFEFPGSPSPPLGLMMKILLSLESWLRADEKNVAVMHCLTGRGRTCTVMSAFLCWVGEAGFGDPNRALEYMAQCKKLDLETLTIPSQRRYVGYFKNMLDGVRPSQPPLLLKRIIMSEVPKVSESKRER
jgi:tensin